jgi:hypothetical protein
MGEVDCMKACSQCSRHVRCGERTCPFCGTALTFFMRAPEYRLKTRLGRGATAALGAALGAAGFVVGCDLGGTAQPSYGGACRPPSCTFPSSGGDAGTGGSGTAGSDQGGGAGAVSEGGAAGAGEEPGEGGAAGR